MTREPRRVFAEVRSSLLTAAAFALLLFPLVAVRVDAVERTATWRWGNLGWISAAVFTISLAWRLWLRADTDGLALPQSAREHVFSGKFWRRGGAEGRSPAAERSEHDGGPQRQDPAALTGTGSTLGRG